MMGEAAVIWGRLTESFWLNCQLFGLTLLFVDAVRNSPPAA